MTPYYLVDIFLVCGSISFLSVTWLVAESVLAARRVNKAPECDHQPEVVLVPMGGPMGPAPKPPTKH